MCLHEITEQSWNRKWTLYTNEIQCTDRWIPWNTRWLWWSWKFRQVKTADKSQDSVCDC